MKSGWRGEESVLKRERERERGRGTHDEEQEEKVKGQEGRRKRGKEMEERQIKKNLCERSTLPLSPSLSLCFSLHSLVSLNENHNPSQRGAAAQGPQHYFLFFSFP